MEQAAWNRDQIWHRTSQFVNCSIERPHGKNQTADDFECFPRNTVPGFHVAKIFQFTLSPIIHVWGSKHSYQSDDRCPGEEPSLAVVFHLHGPCPPT